MIANEADDGVSDFSLAFAVFLTGGVGLVRHAQIGAQDVEANLALLVPVVGKSVHGVDTSETDSGFFVSELIGGCRVSLGKLLGIGSVCVSLGESLLAVAVDADEDGTDKPGDGDRGLEEFERIDGRWATAVGRGDSSPHTPATVSL
jgi:hypothetical protein